LGSEVTLLKWKKKLPRDEDTGLAGTYNKKIR